MHLFPLTAWTLVHLSFLYLFAAADSGKSAKVNLRIEGASSTIFEGWIQTKGHEVTTVLGGTHKCDGTNNGANPTAGPTLTGALDDAARRGQFIWDGPWSPSFEDYFITRIAGLENTSTKFWGLLKGYEFTAVGGCQQRVSDEDQILIAYDAFNAQQFLKLSSTGYLTHVGKPVVVTVENGADQTPVEGAMVNGQKTGADGKVTLTFTSSGPKKLKAEKLNAIRSNEIVIIVGGY